MSKRFNPFTGQTAGKYFVGREEQLSIFENNLRGLAEGVTNHTYVSGIHGTGKTSYLQKITELAADKGFLGSLPTLDDHSRSREHISILLRSLIRKIDRKKQSTQLIDDWNLEKDSTHFKLPHVKTIQSDAVRADFETLGALASECGYLGIVLCIDEGQRIDPVALSAIKNAIQPLSSIMLVLAVRIRAGNAVKEGRLLLDKKAQEAEGDFGASRLFKGIPMGPFANDAEAARCIRKRLEGNRIQFSNSALEHCSKITANMPSELIGFCSALYMQAEQEEKIEVDSTLVGSVFRTEKKIEYEEAKRFCTEISHVDRNVLSSIVRNYHGILPEDVIQEWEVGDDAQAMPAVLSAIESSLSRLKKTQWVKNDKKRFYVEEPLRAYSLRLVLGEFD